jgi:hypothetical protein
MKVLLSLRERDSGLAASAVSSAERSETSTLFQLAVST